ncbi:hypothetical protein G7Y89_g3084 [Cudoniella acicularis]|uniref:G-patch domain-containing protein n=1 Tax=Cudoniella acicularis TaxID=354080 RepID=A0A8H4RS27_9HELO|nr:hypothetical protein G7Y89_g3084 [Cudoniella acicularis]
MDAHALLTSQGWRGTGNSLHPTSNTIGLSRPLLVSKKDNTLGVGKKQHRTSDMWWMNAFDNSLKGLDTSKQGTVVQTITSGGLDMVKKGGARFAGTAAGGGLYASFVRGECLSGTITLETSENTTPEESGTSTPVEVEVKKSKEKRRKEDRKLEKETKEERRARKAARRAARVNDSAPKKDEEVEEAEEVDEDSPTKPETKEERKERRRLKKLAKEAEQKYVEASSEKAKKKKRRKD